MHMGTRRLHTDGGCPHPHTLTHPHIHAHFLCLSVCLSVCVSDYLRKLLDAIFAAADDCPLPIRELMGHLQADVAAKCGPLSLALAQ
jgi:hypothetical protein